MSKPATSLSQLILTELWPDWWASRVAIRAMLKEGGHEFSQAEINIAVNKLHKRGLIKRDDSFSFAITRAGHEALAHGA